MNEMHSISDNPEIFAEGEDDGVALMCGNFDGSFVGSHADMIAMACAIAANVMERCTDRMVNRNLNDGLPAFLVSNPGTQKKLLNLSKLMTLIVGIVAVIIALAIPSVLTVLNSSYTLFTAGVFAPVVAGLLWKRPPRPAPLPDCSAVLPSWHWAGADSPSSASPATLPARCWLWWYSLWYPWLHMATAA